MKKQKKSGLEISAKSSALLTHGLHGLFLAAPKKKIQVVYQQATSIEGVSSWDNSRKWTNSSPEVWDHVNKEMDHLPTINFQGTFVRFKGVLMISIFLSTGHRLCRILWSNSTSSISGWDKKNWTNWPSFLATRQVITPQKESIETTIESIHDYPPWNQQPFRPLKNKVGMGRPSQKENFIIFQVLWFSGVNSPWVLGRLPEKTWIKNGHFGRKINPWIPKPRKKMGEFRDEICPWLFGSCISKVVNCQFFMGNIWNTSQNPNVSDGKCSSGFNMSLNRLKRKQTNNKNHQTSACSCYTGWFKKQVSKKGHFVV